MISKCSECKQKFEMPIEFNGSILCESCDEFMTPNKKVGEGFEKRFFREPYVSMGEEMKNEILNFIEKALDQQRKEIIKEIRGLGNPFLRIGKPATNEYHGAETMKFLILSKLNK